MGKAKDAPYSHYRRSYSITNHAVEQLRARLGSGDELLSREDADLVNWLDDRMSHHSDKRIEAWDKDGKEVDYISFLTVDDQRLWAVVRPDEKTVAMTSVVTVLTDEMMERTTYTERNGFGELSIEQRQPAFLSQDDSAEVLEESQVQPPPPVAVAGLDPRPWWLLSYVAPNGERQYLSVARSDLKQEVQRLLLLAEPGSFALYRPAKLKITFDIDAEDDT